MALKVVTQALVKNDVIAYIYEAYKVQIFVVQIKEF